LQLHRTTAGEPALHVVRVAAVLNELGGGGDPLSRSGRGTAGRVDRDRRCVAADHAEVREVRTLDVRLLTIHHRRRGRRLAADLARHGRADEIVELLQTLQVVRRAKHRARVGGANLHQVSHPTYLVRSAVADVVVRAGVVLLLRIALGGDLETDAEL